MFKTKILAGYTYVNKWGDERIPLGVTSENVVLYVEKMEGKNFTFNPYNSMVKETNFLQKFHLKEGAKPLTGEKIEKLAKHIHLVQMDWVKLSLFSEQGVCKVINNK